MEDWRRMLQEIGGWDNEMVAVPAGVVREIIEEVEQLRLAIEIYRAETVKTVRHAHYDLPKGLP